MRVPSPPHASAVIAALVLAAAASTSTAARYVDFPPAKSPAAVKELIPLLGEKKLDAFAAKDAVPDTFVAVMYVTGQRMFGVSAGYTRPGDIEYFLDHHDYQSAYETLRSSVDAQNRVIIDDAEANGLVPKPKRSQPDDDAVFGVARKTFDGVFAEPKHADPKKLAFDDYLKNFTDADAKYTHILTVAIEALKKTS